MVFRARSCLSCLFAVGLSIGCKESSSSESHGNAAPAAEPPSKPPSPSTESHANVSHEREEQSGERVIWREIVTTDPDAATLFYTEVFGWATQKDSKGYTMWVGSDGPFGGVVRETPEAAKAGVHPAWVATLAVTDVDDVVARVRKNGGHVYAEPADVPGSGRYACVGDADGAVLNVLKPLTPPGSRAPTEVGDFYWSVLKTPDAESAMRFYGNVFGWTKTSEIPIPSGRAGEKYLTYGRAGVDFGGVHAMPGSPGSNWTQYVEVANIDRTIERVKGRHGTMLMQTPVPDGRFALIADPQGAQLAIHETSSAK